MASTSSAEAVPRCCLLELSGELRNRIYRYACTFADPIRIVATKRDTSHTKIPTFSNPSTTPPLAMTNKQIRREVLSIYYAENCFNLIDMQIGDSHRAAKFARSDAALAKLIEFEVIMGERTKLLRSVSSTAGIGRLPTESMHVTAEFEDDGRVIPSIVFRRDDGANGLAVECCTCDLGHEDGVETEKNGSMLLQIIKTFWRNKLWERRLRDEVRICLKCSMRLLDGLPYARRSTRPIPY